MTVAQQNRRTRPARRPDGTPEPAPRGYLALTAALYRDGDTICAELLDFDLATEGDDFDHAYAMIVEAVEGLIAAVYHYPPDSIERFVSDNGLTVHPRPPRTYRPAAIPSHLLEKPGLILRPVVVSLATAVTR